MTGFSNLGEHARPSRAAGSLSRLCSGLGAVASTLRSGGAAVLRAASGRVAAVRRRGTVLVLVIGVLALMAIIVVVYTTIGQGDRRGSAALVRSQRVEAQGRAIADYLAGVIGKDTFKGDFEYDAAYRGINPTTLQPLNGSTPARFIRRAVTNPSISPTAMSVDPALQATSDQTPRSRSVPNQYTQFLVFNSTGTVENPWPTASVDFTTQPDPRRATTPWLASSEPEWLNLKPGRTDADDPASGSHATQPWRDVTDWRHISNFSPSGAFVNLANLRGNFNAESGLGKSANGRSRMTDNLWLSTLGGGATRQVAGADREADLNFPADWATNQVGLFRSVVDTLHAPGDSRFADNQFADTDGDGYLDARWFELVDIRDPNNPRALLPYSGNVRFFIAATARDLSGKVNVNVATQFRSAPSYGEPAGATPADIDLERLLAYVDSYPPFAPAGAGLGSFLQPPGAYAAGAPTSFAGNYRNGNDYDQAFQAVGYSGFAALIDAKVLGTTPPPDSAPYIPGSVRRGVGPFFTGVSSPSGATDVWLPGDRQRSYLFAGSAPSGAVLFQGVTNPSASNPELYQYQGSYGKADELELRTFDGVNNPASTSRFEIVVGGRADGYKNLSPLRDNRPAEVENLARIPADFARLLAYSDVRKRLTAFSGARPLVSADATNNPDFIDPGAETRLDVNVLLDAIGSGLGNEANTIFRIGADALLPYSGELENGPRRNVAWVSSDTGNNNRGTRNRALAYGSDPGNDANLMFRGIGPERAIRLAAHWAANLADGRQSFTQVRTDGQLPLYAGDVPSEFTLRIDGSQEFLDRLANEEGIRYDRTDQRGPRLFGAYDPRQRTTPTAPRTQGVFALDETRLAPPLNPAGNGQAVTDTIPDNPASDLPKPRDLNGLTAQAMTVYGVRPQPFITHAIAFTVYTDSPCTGIGSDPNQPGDADGDLDINCDLQMDPARSDRRITIFGDVTESNKDYVCEVVAFQLHNPFDTTLWLSRVQNTSGVIEGVEDGQEVQPEELRHYIEFGGQFYALADATEPADAAAGLMRTVSLLPGETRAFYIVDQNFDRIAARVRNATALDSSSVNEDLVRKWIDGQLRVNDPITGGGRAPVRLPRINVGTMDADQPSPTEAGVMNRPDLTDPQAPNKYRVVNLWRTVRIEGGEDAGQPNITFNDILVDRLRDPADSGIVTLDQRIPRGQNELLGSEGERDNNEGASVVVWGAIRRPNLPIDTATGQRIPLPLGVLPPWCVETKSTLPSDSAGSTEPWRRHAGVRSLNNSRTVYGGAATSSRRTPDWNDVTNSAAGSRRLVGPTGLIRDAAPDAAPQFKRTPANQQGNDLPRVDITTGTIPDGANLSGRVFPFLQFPMLLPPPRNYAALPGGIGQSYNNAVTLDRQINGGGAVSGYAPVGATPAISRLPVAPPLRPADVLLPPAVGPSKIPGASLIDPTNPGSQLRLTDRRNLDVQWTTLAEAAALALDYDSPADQRDPDYRLGAELSSVSDVQGALLRGALRTDLFVPFDDRPNGGTVAFFDPPVDTNGDGIQDEGDTRRGSGLPMALTIIDRLKTSKFGSDTALVHGTVNLNTAPRAVLRTLPMLSPDPAGWMALDVVPPLWDPVGADPWDLATTLRAYGDKSWLLTRTTGGLPDGLPVNFRNDNNGDYDPSSTNPFGRGYTTGIPALREEPGFALAAEVVAARQAPVRVGETNVPAAELDRRLQTSMDRFGRDGERFSVAFSSPSVPGEGVAGLASYYYRIPPNVAIGNNPPSPLPLALPSAADDPGESLALANALLNTVSVRSDLFCVWFVVRGYQPSDVEDLLAFTGTGTPPNDPRYRTPMVPSIERRYVMVVDRSNVTKLDDKPRILMLEEVSPQD